jgi:FkbM family methyltransferase
MNSTSEPQLALVQRIHASLYERARWFARRSRLGQLSDELGLGSSSEIDIETAETLATIKAHLHGQVRTIIDVGAHVGGFAEPAMRVLGADEVVCIEPFLPLHARLHERLMGLKHRILDCALADTPGDGTLYAHADPSMNSLLDSERDILAGHFDTYDHRAIEPLPIRVSTLDDELATLCLDEPFFIKLDTQGTELRILRGARQTLQRAAAILVEHMFTTPYLGQASFSDLIGFLAERRFGCAAVTSITRRKTHVVSAVDFLFVAER